MRIGGVKTSRGQAYPELQENRHLNIGTLQADCRKMAKVSLRDDITEWWCRCATLMLDWIPACAEITAGFECLNNAGYSG